jgi:cytochrome c oxidase subunit 2
MLGWLPEDVSPYGAGIDALFYFIYYLTAAAFIIVTALMLIFLYVYRDQGGRRATYTHGNTAMEIIWTIIPAIIFIALGLVSRSLWEEIKLVPPETDTVVKVTGKQFNWEILYPGPDGEFDTADDKQIDNDIRVPAGKPIRVILASKDVIHSFFMPNLRFKQDMVPGREITGWFQANKPGKYEIPCAELCGFGHSGMKGWLYALAPEEYQSWRDEQWPQTASSNGASDTATEAVAEAQDPAETAPETTAPATEAAPEAIQSATESAQDAGTEATQDAASPATAAAGDAAETVQETSDAAQKASEGTQDATEAAKEATDAANEATTESVEGAAQDTTSAVQGTSDAVQDVAEGITDSAAKTAQDARQGASAALQEGTEQAGVAAASTNADPAVQTPKTEMPQTQSAQEAPAEQSSPEATSGAAGQDSSADVSSQQYAYTPTAAGQSNQGEPCKGQLEILSGATIYDIAGAFYAEGKRLLGVDLIRDYNTHIKNLDNIYPGQKLCLPTLAQTTRLRQEQESGSFNLILDTFRSTRKARTLARSVQQKGYRASVIPRQVSNSLLLQRVEITGLQDQTTASQAWELFSGDDVS